jgi:hypothetical protein
MPLRRFEEVKMRTVREQLLVEYGGWGWEEWARQARYDARGCEEAVGQWDMPQHSLQKIQEANYHWVWCLMYFLMGMKEGE